MVPYGYLIVVIFIEVGALIALSPPPKRGRLGAVAFRVGVGFNELPGPALLFLIGSTVFAFARGDIKSPAAWGVVGAAGLSAVLLCIILWRGLETPIAVERALTRGLGATNGHFKKEREHRAHYWLGLLQSVFVPFLLRRTDVERTRDVSYGPEGTRNLLDVYRKDSPTAGAPILIYWHGGGYYSGVKNLAALPLLYRMAGRGWVCFSANYRLRPVARFEDHMIDAKRAIAWVRQQARDYGADPDRLIVSGSSAGGHLASISALTPNDPRFQPGFENERTDVAAAISLGGYYGDYYGTGNDGQTYTSPLDYDTSDAPPFFIAHGNRDTLVPISHARQLVAHLRSGSRNPVVYAELPYGQHSFDLFRSPRFEAVIDGIEGFTDWLLRSENSESRSQ